jgi:hypothetical protein
MIRRFGIAVMALVVAMTSGTSAQVPDVPVQEVGENGPNRVAPKNETIRELHSLSELLFPGKAGENTSNRAAPKTETIQDLPDSLSELLSLSLRSNPDVVLAKAKVQAAEAELRQVQLRAAQDVTTTHKQLAICTTRLNSVKSGLVSGDEKLEREEERVRLEAKLRYLVGIRYGLSDSAASPYSGDESQRELRKTYGADSVGPPKLPEAVLEKLNTMVNCDFAETPLQEVLESFSRQVSLPFLPGASLRSNSIIQTTKVSLQLGEVPLRTAMTAIADGYGFAFVIRDYGVLVIIQNEAGMFKGTVVP